jgi:non-canonical poly(A) RNA polymerase PAPD5/7
MDKVNDIVGSLFPRGFIQLYGSYATGLALPWSDIDIVVVNSGVYSSDHLVTSLKVLGTVLSQCSWVSQIIVLDKAAVPVVKLTADGSYFGCDQPIEADISIDEYGLERASNSGMATTLLTQDILTETPQVATLCFFLKQLLHKHKLNSGFKGKA